MWEFIPARANWTGSTERSCRRSKSAAHALGTSWASASYASIHSDANVTSSCSMNAGSVNTDPPASPDATASVTVRYIRLNTAAPSSGGSSSSIRRRRAMTSCTDDPAAVIPST